MSFSSLSKASACLVLPIALASTAVHVAARPQQQPTFREQVDVIEVDVRVVNGSGAPIAGLDVDKFQVSVGGKMRRVVSADFVRYGAPQPASVAAAAPAAPPPVWQTPRSLTTQGPSGRIFILYMDSDTFDVGSSRGVMTAARSFVDRLQPDDQVGLYVFPIGPQISPTTERKPIVDALANVVGVPAVIPATEFNLRPSEVVDLSVSLMNGIGKNKQGDALVMQLCGTDPPCLTRLENEVRGLAMSYESQTLQSFATLRSFLKNLADVPGRKTLVLLSGGVVTGDGPGARPDMSGIELQVGQDAQHANTAIYALFVDWRYTQQNSAEVRRARNTQTSIARDSLLLSRSLDLFAGSSGGVLMKALTGSGEVAFNQILDETSAYYVLGVEPAESDRDGKPRQLDVKVKQSGVTVRGSRWVTVPKR